LEEDGARCLDVGRLSKPSEMYGRGSCKSLTGKNGLLYLS
jgi:hypothetical protein